MNKISINIHVPKAAAIAGGIALWGDSTFEPSADQIGELSTLQATELLRFEGDDAKERLQLERYDADMWPIIKDALAKAVVDAQDRAAARAEKAKARIELQKWAANQDQFPAVREAARLEYDVGTRYVYEVGQKIAAFDVGLNGLKTALITCTEQLAKNATFEPRPSPSLFALTIESRLRTLVGIDRELFAPGTTIDVSGVQRLTPVHGLRQTVVTVAVAHLASNVGVTVIWSAEDHRALDPSMQELRYTGPE